ncbi:hypothetical protein FRC03_008042 [Tulasnella sp. 419]|nr:hypothetical protein FRC03_008042 [Tulasnella sp. 419]
MMMRFWKSAPPSPLPPDETLKEDSAVQTDGDDPSLNFPSSQQLKSDATSAVSSTPQLQESTPNLLFSSPKDDIPNHETVPPAPKFVHRESKFIEGGNSPQMVPSELDHQSPSQVQPFPAINDDGIGEPAPDPPAQTSNTKASPTSAVGRIRKLSLRSFAYFYGRDKSTTNLPVTQEIIMESEEEIREYPPSPTSPTPSAGAAKLRKERVSKADQRATGYAILLRSLIVGNPFVSGTPQTPASNPKAIKTPFKKPKPPLKKLKSELLKPSEANRVIAQLRQLPTPDASSGVIHGTVRMPDGKLKEEDVPVIPQGGIPIHGVCLDCTDDAADQLHFSHLTSSTAKPGAASSITRTNSSGSKGKNKGKAEARDVPPNIATADLNSVVPMLQGLKLVDLVSADDFGFGQPLGGAGILSGSVPSPMTIGQGLMEVGQQLLNLGFATSQAVLPSHKGIYPPTDRLSVLSYWWGYEIVMPPPSMKYLSNVKSISNALLNFLTAFSLFNNGVRELLPFIRYASQFIDFEWNAIKAQDKGKGVVCAATWVMPAALVPRPWDFEEPKADKTNAKAFFTTTTTIYSESNATMLSSMSPPPLPGTEIIILPTNPESPNPNAPLVPVVTLTPPMNSKSIEETEEQITVEVSRPSD